jgi:hypothetical protein
MSLALMRATDAEKLHLLQIQPLVAIPGWQDAQNP